MLIKCKLPYTSATTNHLQIISNISVVNKVEFLIFEKYSYNIIWLTKFRKMQKPLLNHYPF